MLEVSEVFTQLYGLHFHWALFAVRSITKAALSSTCNYLNSLSSHLYSVHSVVDMPCYQYCRLCVQLQHNPGWLYPFIFKPILSSVFFLLSALSFSLSKTKHSNQSLWSAVAFNLWCKVVWAAEMFIYSITSGSRVISRAVQGSSSCSPVLICLLFTIWIVYVMCKWYSFLKAVSNFSSLTCNSLQYVSLTCHTRVCDCAYE